MSENKIPARKLWIPGGLILTLCVINVLVLKQNLDLRKQLAVGGRTLDVTTNSLKAGDLVDSLTGTDLGGRSYKLEYKKDGRQHLLLFFSPNCPYCVQQTSLWRNLLENVDSNRFTVVGVVSDKEDKQLVSAHAEGAGYFKTKTPLRVVFLNSESLGRYKLWATPTTLLINEDGKVEHAWVGKWDDDRASEVAMAMK